MVAITGATGLVGSQLIRKFSMNNVSIIGIRRNENESPLLKDIQHLRWRNGDITLPELLTDAFKDVDTVIHCAGLVSFNPSKQKLLYQINEEGTKNVVNACLASGVKKLIFISSVAALGRSKEVKEINESSPWQESDLNTDYAISKYKAELEAWRGQEEGLQVAVINPSVILSPGIITNSSAKVFEHVMKERIFYADGIMNYVDGRDLADIVWKIYSENIFGEKYIVSSGTVEIKNLLDQIALRLNKKAPSIKVPHSLLKSLARLEEWRCALMGSEPLITTQSIKIANQKFYYSNKKIINQLGIQFKSLESTLDWCCTYYKSAYSNNN